MTVGEGEEGRAGLKPAPTGVDVGVDSRLRGNGER